MSRRSFLKRVGLVCAALAVGHIPGSDHQVLPLRPDPVLPWEPGLVDNLLPAGFLHTAGRHIVGPLGAPVRLAGVNWYGGETNAFIPGGLDHQSIDRICGLIRELGFNSIRLPFSVEMVLTNPVITKFVAAEPQLEGKRALEVMDAVIAGAQRHGLKLILDNHRSNAGWSAQENGLWYTPQWGEHDFIESWMRLVRRYKGNPTVIGCDLRNEPDTPPTDLTETLSSGGSLWGEDGHNFFNSHPRDWASIAERLGNKILGASPDLLMFVEGVRWDPAGPKVFGIPVPYWPGGNLIGLKKPGGGRLKPRLIKLNVPNRLVYAPHDYGTAIFSGVPWLQTNDGGTEAKCRQVWDEMWGFIVKENIAPVWLGEFGTPNGINGAGPETYTHINSKDTQGSWFSYLVKYIDELEIGWSFWALNGTDSLTSSTKPTANEWYGVLTPQWDRAASVPMMSKLRTIQGPIPDRFGPFLNL